MNTVCISAVQDIWNYCMWPILSVWVYYIWIRNSLCTQGLFALLQTFCSIFQMICALNPAWKYIPRYSNVKIWYIVSDTFLSDLAIFTLSSPTGNHKQCVGTNRPHGTMSCLPKSLNFLENKIRIWGMLNG